MANFFGESLNDKSRVRYQRSGSINNAQAVGTGSMGQSIHTLLVSLDEMKIFV
jgi:hypothetical protein